MPTEAWRCKTSNIFLTFHPVSCQWSCWSDQDACDVWQDSAVAGTGPQVLQSVHVCTCVCDCECVFSKYWAHIQHLCLGCVWSPGPQPNKLRGVWMLNISGSSACLSLHLCSPLTAEEQHTPLPPFSDCTAVWNTHSGSATAGDHL